MGNHANDGQGVSRQEPRAKLQSYQNLLVWQLGMDLAVACYSVTKLLPKEELYGMTSQIRRAAASVPANIAEGYGRENRGDYIRFLQIAQGSLKETETHLLICERVGLLSEDKTVSVLSICSQAGRMLRGLIRSVQDS